MVGLQYDQEQNLAIFSAQGAIALRDIVSAVTRWIEHPNFADDVNMLWDLRGCNWQTAVSEFLLLAKEITNRVNDIWQGTKVAWLVDTETEVALVDAHLGTLGWRAMWRGFTRQQEAYSWLQAANGADSTRS